MGRSKKRYESVFGNLFLYNIMGKNLETIPEVFVADRGDRPPPKVQSTKPYRQG